MNRKMQSCLFLIAFLWASNLNLLAQNHVLHSFKPERGNENERALGVVQREIKAKGIKHIWVVGYGRKGAGGDGESRANAFIRQLQDCCFGNGEIVFESSNGGDRNEPQITVFY